MKVKERCVKQVYVPSRSAFQYCCDMARWASLQIPLLIAKSAPEPHTRKVIHTASSLSVEGTQKALCFLFRTQMNKQIK